MYHFIYSLQKHSYYPHFIAEKTKIQKGKQLGHCHTAGNQWSWDCTSGGGPGGDTVNHQGRLPPPINIDKILPAPLITYKFPIHY